jgi:hypothetical protein
MSAAEVQTLKHLLALSEERLRGKEELLRVKEEQLKGKDEQLKGKDALLESKEGQLKAFQIYSLEMSRLVKDAFLKELAGVKFELDVAKNSMHARAVFEACVEELWMDACTARQAARVANPRLPELASGTTTDKWTQMLRVKDGASPHLILAFRQAAKDNGLSEKNLLRQAQKLYDVLSERPHGQPTEGVLAVPINIFSSREFAVAFCVPVNESGRDLKLYVNLSGDGTGVGAQQVMVRQPGLTRPETLDDMNARSLVEMVVARDFYRTAKEKDGGDSRDRKSVV